MHERSITFGVYFPYVDLLANQIILPWGKCHVSDVTIEIFLNEQTRCQKWKTNMYMFLWTNILITLKEFITLKRGVICIIWFEKQDTTLRYIAKSRKIVNPWRSWNKHVNSACCSLDSGNFLNRFFKVYIFNMNYNVIRTSIPYLYYKFIVKCYYNKSLVQCI